MMILVFVALLGGGYYFTTPMERERMLLAAKRRYKHVRPILDELRFEPGAFGDALRERTPTIVATPALAAIGVVIYVLMLVGPGHFSDPETLIGRGGSWGPLTTNGEWWRLVTAIFVHAGLLHVVANTLALVQLGLILERLFGRAAFAATYVGAGMLTTLASLAIDPVTVTVGATGAVLGIHGLLAAALITGRVFPSPMTIPLITLVRVAPASGLFVLYSVLSGRVGWPELAGLVVGFVFGLVVARGVGDRPASSPRVATSMAIVCIVTIVSAAPLRGVADVKPEIERVVAVERSTAAAYDAAVNRFQNGQLTTAGMADVIDRTILPELAAAEARLKKLDGVPRQHKPLVDGAQQYFDLREASWLARVEGLRKAKTPKLREAETIERAALDALDKVKPPEKSAPAAESAPAQKSQPAEKTRPTEKSRPAPPSARRARP